MVCLMWVLTLINILRQSMQWYVKYHAMLDRVITTPDCIFHITSGASNYHEICTMEMAAKLF